MASIETNTSNTYDLAQSRVLITGASGSLGKQLVYELAKRGIKPVAHVRESSDTTFIDSLDLEKRQADLRIRPELSALVQDIDVVIHTAAWVDFRANRLTQFTGTNTIGALELYRAAKAAGVKRFVHISTVAAIGAVPRRNDLASHETPRRLNETWEFNLEHLKIPYIMSKQAAEMELLKLAAEGRPELVIVNPSIIVSPTENGSDRERWTKSFSRWFVPDYPNRLNLVDIRDLAPGILTVAERGRPGERYILGGDNTNARELILNVSILLKKIPHLVTPPRPLLNLLARLSVMWGGLTGKGKVSFYPDLVKMLDYDWAYSSLKARRELGYRTRSNLATLKDYLTDEFTDSYAKPEL